MSFTVKKDDCVILKRKTGMYQVSSVNTLPNGIQIISCVPIAWRNGGIKELVEATVNCTPTDIERVLNFKDTDLKRILFE